MCVMYVSVLVCGCGCKDYTTYSILHEGHWSCMVYGKHVSYLSEPRLPAQDRYLRLASEVAPNSTDASVKVTASTM